jgi:hypothetical protein
MSAVGRASVTASSAGCGSRHQIPVVGLPWAAGFTGACRAPERSATGTEVGGGEVAVVRVSADVLFFFGLEAS